MGLRASGFAFVIVLCGAATSFAQQATGPATLENLLDKEAHSATRPVALGAAEAGARGQGPKGRLKATVVRPASGVQHPDLDKAWADYEAAVAKAAESLKAAITKQFDEATAKGDLDAAEKWQAALDTFEKSGDLPALSETRAVVNTASSDCKKAKEGLSKAYEAVVKALTMAKQIEEAKATRDEWATLSEVEKAPTLADRLRKHRYRKVIISPTGQRQELNEVFTFTEEGDVLINGKVSLKWQPLGQDGVRIDIGPPHGFVELRVGPDSALKGHNKGRTDRAVWGWELLP